MASFSIDELLGVLQKSGLPFGSGEEMKKASPFAKYPVQEQVFSQDHQIEGIKKGYMDKLAKVAQMDQKLAGVYSNPNSNMFIENPIAREKLRIGAENVGYKEAGDIIQRVPERTKELNDQADQALDVYKELVKEQVATEKELKKKGKKGKSSGGIKLTKEQKLAGFQDAAAANYWSKIKETDFKREWIQNILSEAADVPDEGYSIKDIKDRYEPWRKKYEAGKGKKKNKSSGKTTTTERKPLF